MYKCIYSSSVWGAGGAEEENGMESVMVMQGSATKASVTLSITKIIIIIWSQTIRDWENDRTEQTKQKKKQLCSCNSSTGSVINYWQKTRETATE